MTLLWFLIWLGLFSLLAIGVVICIINRHKIKKWFYNIKYPHKIIKAQIHYPNNKHENLIRLLPIDNEIKDDKELYFFHQDDMSKHIDMHDKFAFKKKNDEKVYFRHVDKESKKECDYVLDLSVLHKEYDKDIPEIHYFAGCPNPIIFDFDKKTLDLSSKQLDEFKQNDLVSKLLRLSDELNLLMIILIVVCVTLLGVLFIIAKMQGWIHG